MDEDEASVSGDMGPGAEAEGEAAVFRGTEYSVVRTTVALALWLGGIHFNAALVLTALLLLPARLAAASVPFLPHLSLLSFFLSFFLKKKKKRKNIWPLDLLRGRK